MKDVCVIGAGACGISAIRQLKAAGLDPVCYEKGSDVGGVWRYNNDNGHSAAYRSLHINTNRYMMAYPDFPMPETYPMFPHHSDIIRYFEAYTTHYELRPHIRFRTEVQDVSQLPGGGWRVRTDAGTEDFRHVVIANGHHWNPRWPEPPFPGTFTGEIMHSHSYREVSQVQNRDVLILGLGNSAADIACEAARLHTGKVVISTRSGAYITPNWLLGMPFDSLASPFTAMLPLPLKRLLLYASLYLARGAQTSYGVPVPKRPILTEHPTVSQDLLPLAGRGQIRFKPNISRYEGREVYFEDGSHESFDLIIYATGYRITFPFLRYEAFDVSATNELRLYHKVIHPDYPGLYFAGLIQPLGAIMPLADVQNQWIARLITGQCRLPAPAQMQATIESDRTNMQKQYLHRPRHTVQVDFFEYKSLIVREMKKMKTS
ncbi:MAG: NAD(P)-binding domain-containing protein [Bacteroidia bacterium]|nr:NAD(P)-binding domain-containing protein [Bacteroidia bacterium]